MNKICIAECKVVEKNEKQNSIFSGTAAGMVLAGTAMSLLFCGSPSAEETVAALDPGLFSAAPSPKEEGSASGFGGFYGVGVVSDYISRGISGSDGKPAFQFFGEISYDNFYYMNLYGSTVSYPSELGLSDPPIEYNLAAGIRPAWGPFIIDIGGYYTFYPHENRKYMSMESGEFYIMPTYRQGNLTLSTGAFYTEHWGGTTASGLYTPISMNYVLSDFSMGGVTPYVTAEFGHEKTGDIQGFNLPDYNHWGTGFGATYKNIIFDVKYTNTNVRGQECAFVSGSTDWCDETVTAGVSITF